MAEAAKKSGFKPKLQKAKEKFLATYYSNPAKDLRIVAVTGKNGRDITAHYLYEIIKIHDPKVGLIIDPKTTSDLYRQIYKHWKTGTDHVVISIDSAALANHLFYGMPIYVAVLTEDGQGPEDTATSEAQSILFNAQPAFSILSRDSESFQIYSQYPAKTATLTYGKDRESDLRINYSKAYKMGTEVNVTYSGRSFDMATYITGEASINYMAAAALAGLAIDFSTDDIVDGIAYYEPKPTK